MEFFKNPITYIQRKKGFGKKHTLHTSMTIVEIDEKKAYSVKFLC